MMILRQYRHFVRIATLGLLISFCVVYLPSWFIKGRGIVDYVPSRDKAAIHKMFKDDWGLLISDESLNSYSVDFMLDNRSPSQYAKVDKLVLKVLRVDDKTVGFMAYYPKTMFWWHLLFLCVDKDYRQKGYAAKMLQYVMNDMMDRGAVKISIFTRLKNTKARNLYENKFGFKDVEHYDDKYMDLVWYKSNR